MFVVLRLQLLFDLCLLVCLTFDCVSIVLLLAFLFWLLIVLVRWFVFKCSDSGFGYIVLTLRVVWLGNCYVAIVVGFTFYALVLGYGCFLF